MTRLNPRQESCHGSQGRGMRKEAANGSGTRSPAPSTIPTASLEPCQNVVDLVTRRLPTEIDPWDPQSLYLTARDLRSEEHTSELQSHSDLVCRLLLEKKKKMMRGQRVLGDALRP